MKRSVLILALIIPAAVYAQEVIHNPKTPKSEDAGRVLKLEEEFQIDGQGESYYFNGANKLLLDGSGNIYMHDSWSSQQRSHLLKFSPGGKFLLDLYRQGEGPGEIQSAFDFVLDDAEVFLYDWMKRKIIVENPDGKFIKEFKSESGSLGDFIGTFDDWLVFCRRENPAERKTSKLYDVNNVIVFLSKNGESERDFFVFVNQTFYVSHAQGLGSMNWDPFTAVMGDDMLFVNRTSEYLVEVLDLTGGEIKTRFSREYSRVKHELQKWEKDFVAKFNAPKKKFEHDVERLFYDRGRLWVKTSIKDDEKGSLFDVFDTKGQFLDSFYLNIQGRILKIDGDILYAAEIDEDELPLIVKYRILNSSIRGQVPN